MEASGNGKSLCHKAEEYYYDLLCRDDRAVPEAIARHVEGCPFCRRQIRLLAEAFSETGDPADTPERPRDTGDIEALSRQFEFLGEHVGCSEVKAFLPDLSIPSRQIRIPTPITVHVEHCPQCAKELASIRDLGLAADQLRRLSLFYSRPAVRDRLCRGRAPSTAAALAAFSLDETHPEALDHVSRCPRCRALVQRHRAQALARLPGRAGRGGLRCVDISAADLFDYVMPFGLDAAAIAEAVGRCDAIVTHLRACRRCMEKVQSLHRTIYAVAERADSDVRTRYLPEGNPGDARAATQAPVYRYAVHVEVAHTRAAQAAGPDESSVGFGGSARRVPAGSRTKLPLKAAFAAAAAIAIVVFLVNAPTATGMSVRSLMRAVERAANVHVANWHGDNPQPGSEIWRAKDLGVFAMKNGDECTVYDLGKRTKRMIHPDLGPGDPVRLKSPELERCRTFMHESLGSLFGAALPDDDLSPSADVPSDRPEGKLSVYELTRENRSSRGDSVLHQWRVFIDPALGLPVRIEYSRREPEQPTWEPMGVTTFHYPSAIDMDSEITVLLQTP